jgi:glycosyltransferase involved in cell wall biosynthesis
MSAPKVSAIVPTRDRPELLERAVRSILAQRYPGPVECVVVFDQQTPRDLDVRIPRDRTLRSIANHRSPGLAGARNSGTDDTEGPLIAFCDDDDEWHPDKLRLQVEALEAQRTAPLATCGIWVLYKDRAIPRVPRERVITLDQLLRSRRMEVHSSTLLLRRDFFVNDIGPVDEEIPGGYGEDYDLLLRAAAVSPLAAVPQPLVRVYWQSSFFADRWQMIVPALRYQLRKHPELGRHPRNLSRMLGRMAFAYAASGERSDAREWARRSIRLDWRQPRGYLAYGISLGLLKPQIVMRVANWLGRGV